MNGRVAIASILLGSIGVGVWLASRAGAGATQPVQYQIPEELKFWNPGMRQTVLSAEGASYSVSYSCPGSKIVVNIQEENPTTLEWEQSRYTYSTSFSITGVTAREGGLELYVSGIQLSADGDWADVIERWTFSDISGAHVGRMDDPVAPRGTPLSPFSPSVYIAGTSYKPHAQRSGQPTPTRTLLYRGKAYQHIHAMQVDAEGRFLLFHSSVSGNVHSLNLLQVPMTIGLEFAAGANPNLLHVRSAASYDDPVAGRIYRLSPVKPTGSGALATTSEFTLLFDADNDGYFESSQVFTKPTLESMPFGDTTEWRDLDNYGWDWKADFD